MALQSTDTDRTMGLTIITSSTFPSQIIGILLSLSPLVMLLLVDVGRKWYGTSQVDL